LVSYDLNPPCFNKIIHEAINFDFTSRITTDFLIFPKQTKFLKLIEFRIGTETTGRTQKVEGGE
jgi:hypothetical protein